MQYYRISILPSYYSTYLSNTHILLNFAVKTKSESKTYYYNIAQYTLNILPLPSSYSSLPNLYHFISVYQL